MSNHQIQKKSKKNSLNEINEIQIAEYKEAFQIFDKHGEGLIHSKELGLIMRCLGLNPSEEDLKEIIDKFDNDKYCGFIDFNSFLTIMANRDKYIDREEDLLDAFRVFDKENTGKISAKELRYVLMSSGDDLNENEIEDMIHETSTDNDNIDYYKFVKLIMS